MNTKIAIVVVLLVLAVGAFFVLGNKNSNTNNNTSITPTQSTEQNKSGEESMEGSMEGSMDKMENENNETSQVTLTQSGFSPKDITVSAGTKVVWTNNSGKAATVNSDDHPTHKKFPFLNLGEFGDGESLDVVFDTPGVYTYHNHYNASETGSVTVK